MSFADSLRQLARKLGFGRTARVINQRMHEVREGLDNQSNLLNQRSVGGHPGP